LNRDDHSAVARGTPENMVAFWLERDNGGNVRPAADLAHSHTGVREAPVFS